MSFPPCKVVVHPPDQEYPAFPELAGRETKEAEIYGIGILEEATPDGQCAIGVIGEFEDGTPVCIRLTEADYRAAHRAIEEAAKRFAEKSSRVH